MADDVFEIPDELDLSTPQDLRKWFHLRGRHYPVEKEAEMLARIPGLVKQSGSLGEKDRDQYVEYLQERYTRDPLFIPARYRRTELEKRGVPAQDVYKMQEQAVPTLSNIYRDVTSGKLPHSAEALIPVQGLTIIPDIEESIDEYQLALNQSDHSLNEAQRVASGLSSLDLRPSVASELLRRTKEDTMQRPVSGAEVMGDISTLAGAGMGLGPAFLQIPSLVKKGYATGAEALSAPRVTMMGQRIKDAILGRAGQKPQAPSTTEQEEQ